MTGQETTTHCVATWLEYHPGTPTTRSLGPARRWHGATPKAATYTERTTDFQGATPWPARRRVSESIMLNARLTADAFQALPEPLREHYKQTDPTKEDSPYELDVAGDGTFALTDVSTLQNSLTRERELKSGLEQSLKPWQTLFGDDASATDLAQKVRDLEAIAAESGNKVPKADLQALAQEEAAKVQKELQGKIDEANKSAAEAAKQRDQMFLQSEVMRHAKQVELRDGSERYVLGELAREATVDWSTGEPIAKLRDGEKPLRFSREKGRESEPMSIGERLAEMKMQESTSLFFRGKQSEQIGASGAGGAPGTGKLTFDPSNPGDPAFQALAKRDPAAANALVAQAYTQQKQ